METYTIGQLAKEANVNLETIRYYERHGLIAEPPRNPSGHRQYPEAAVIRTKFIKRTQALGFTLKEISDILTLRMELGTTCGDIKSRVETKIEDVEQKIADLKHIHKALLQMVSKCIGEGPVGECAILEALYQK
jgi:MerR family mercuric resistance operon transcriptional regulator